MTIDERIERLTERHEALAQSVEILRDSVHEMAASVVESANSIKAVGAMLGPMLESMKTLSETVIRHENRLDRLEGRA